MCGLDGFIGGFVPGLMTCMNEAQMHRRPDGSGILEDADQGAALGHVRLVILDLTSLAAQPMQSPDGHLLAFNGEIYNFMVLRDDLVKKGDTFSSSGDTEVLPHDLQHYWEAFLERLSSMFALALWDRHERTLLAARDLSGIKRFYYTEVEIGSLLFASELKALFAHASVKREPDFEILLQHLAYCYASGDRTAVKVIHRLPLGSLLSWNASTCTCSIRRFWHPSFEVSSNGDRGQAVEGLRQSLRAATVRLI